MIVAIIRGRHCQEYIGKCIASLAKQQANWRAQIVLDAPEDKSQVRADLAIALHQIGSRVKLDVNEQRLGLTANMTHAIDLANPADEDVLAIVDADDWLPEYAFHKIEKVYEKYPQCLLTYGSYIKVSKGKTTKRSRQYPDGCDVRKAYWRCSHLKTFKYKLYKRIPLEYLLDDQNGWIPVASDVALTIPMLELAGLDRTKFIRKVMYYWRDETPFRTDRKAQIKWEKYIRSKKPLERIEQL